MMFAPLLLLPSSRTSAALVQPPASQTPPGLLANDTTMQGVPGLFASLLNLHAKAASKPAFPVLLPEQKASTETPEPVKKELSDPFINGTLVIENVYILSTPPIPPVLPPIEVVQTVISSDSTHEPLPANPLSPSPVMTPLNPLAAQNNFDADMAQTPPAEPGTLLTPARPVINRPGYETMPDESGFTDAAEPARLNGHGEVAGGLHPPASRNDLDADMVQAPPAEAAPLPTPARPVINRPGYETTPDESGFTDAVEPARLNGHGEVAGGLHPLAGRNNFDADMAQTPPAEPGTLLTPARPVINRPGYETTPDESGFTDAVEPARLNGHGEVAGGLHPPASRNNFDAELGQTPPAEAAPLPTPARPVINHPGYETTPDESGFTDAVEPARLNGHGEVAGGLHPPASRNDLDADMVQAPPAEAAPLPTPARPALNRPASRNDLDAELGQTPPAEAAPLPTPARPALNRPGYETTPDESGFTDAAEPARLNEHGEVAGGLHPPAGRNNFDAELGQTPPAEAAPLPTPARPALNRPGYETTPDESGFTDAAEPARLNGRGEVAGGLHPPVGQNDFDAVMASTPSAASADLPTPVRPLHVPANQPQFDAEMVQTTSPNDALTPAKPAVKKETLITDIPENMLPSGVDTFPRMPLNKETSAPQFVTQISQAAESLVKAKHTTLHLQLSPETLGPIDLQLTSGMDGTRVKLVTHLSETGTLLTHHLEDLRASLAQAGVAVNGLVVQYQGSDGQSGWARAWYQPPAQPAPSGQNFSEKEALSESDELSPHPDVSGLDYRI